MQPPSHGLHPCAPELGWQSLCLGGILQEARKKKINIPIPLCCWSSSHGSSAPGKDVCGAGGEQTAFSCLFLQRGNRVGAWCCEGVFGGNIYLYLLFFFFFFGEEGVFCAGQLLPGSCNNLAKRGGK